ncbi:hypothetical protein KEM56_001355 [Ascosphaera pollenicola]|nr:hypothetical protein KEM56_001355 [Ascosphaera pollenicola]
MTAFQDKRNLYQILGVSTAATKDEIKKKFYALSLAHHPDVNRDKPKSSSEYSLISAAYNTLSDDAARRKYDVDNDINKHPHPSHGNSKSHVGSRPASGLSKRRTPFHGPPPSFYTHGRYGKTGRKAPMPSSQRKDDDKPKPTEPEADWFVDDNQVPHFDAKSHLKTQQNQDERRRKRRIASMEGEMKRRPDVSDDDVGGTEATRFIMLSAVVGFAAAVTLLFGGRAASHERKNAAERYEQKQPQQPQQQQQEQQNQQKQQDQQDWPDQEEVRRQKQVAEGGQN